MFYTPVMESRYFRRGVKYDKINWKDFSDVVQNFETRMEDWYIKPGAALRRQSWDNSFALMGIICMLIDALSQYEAGHIRSSQETFKGYVQRRLPELGQSLPIPVKQPGAGTPLQTFADVLYVGFRCGIVHEAHVALYGGLAGLGGKLCDIDTDICTKYEDGKTCPMVRMDPTAMFPELRGVFHTYIRELLNPARANNQLRQKFKRKFKSSFGIDLGDSKL